MNTCKDCDHWGKTTVGKHDDVEFDSYEERHYCWLLSKKERKGKVISALNDAESVSHGIGGANIATGSDFGCIHWEKKDE